MGKKALILGIIATCVALEFVGKYLTFETVFPGLVFYHLMTFSLSYPKARKLRKLVIGFLLCFIDIIFTVLVYKNSLNYTNIFIWSIQFMIIYVIIANSRIKGLYLELAGTNFRCVVFLMAGYLKSTSLASFMICYFKDVGLLSWASFMMLISLSLLKVIGTQLIYVLDNFYWTTESRIMTQQDFTSRLQNGFGSILLILASILYFGLQNQDDLLTPLFISHNFYPKLLANAYFFVWYGFEALEYGNYYKKVN